MVEINFAPTYHQLFPHIFLRCTDPGTEVPTKVKRPILRVEQVLFYGIERITARITFMGYYGVIYTNSYGINSINLVVISQRNTSLGT